MSDSGNKAPAKPRGIFLKKFGFNTGTSPAPTSVAKTAPDASAEFDFNPQSNNGSGKVFTSRKTSLPSEEEGVNGKMQSSGISSTSSVSSSQKYNRQITTSEVKTSTMRSSSSSAEQQLKTSFKGLNHPAAYSLGMSEIPVGQTPLSPDGKEPVITYPESPPPNMDVLVTQHSPLLSSKCPALKENLVPEDERLAAFRDNDTLKMQMAGDVAFQHQQQSMSSAALKSLKTKQEQRTLMMAGEGSQQNVSLAGASARRMESSTGSFMSEKKAAAAASSMQQMATTQKQQSNFTMTSSSSQQHEHRQHHSSSSNRVTERSISIKQLSDSEFLKETFQDLTSVNDETDAETVQNVIVKYCYRMKEAVTGLTSGKWNKEYTPNILDKIADMVMKAWLVPTHGHELGNALCNAFRSYGGLDMLIENFGTEGVRAAEDVHLSNAKLLQQKEAVQLTSAKLLQQCLTTENRIYIVDKGLDKVVRVASEVSAKSNTYSKIGSSLLEHFFKHSEGTCSDVIRLGGLDAVLYACRKNDIETLRHCASALANLSLYGGGESHEAMITRKVPEWLFPLAFNDDDNVKYYACLAIAVLVANKEIEAAVIKSGTLDLVEPFVTKHNPADFAKSNLAYAHGQSKNWLQRLVPVLSSKREEARSLAAFHFCMEAGIKKCQGHADVFRQIGAIESLKQVASCPNAIASKYAAQALRLIGEDVPHKLSQQVPLWSVEDVVEWVKQIGFAEYCHNFAESRVDGDLLMQLAEQNLKDDIGILNGIRRRRFTRELQNLKKMADYSSRDVANLNEFLQNIGPEFSIYTYSMLNAGVDKECIRCLSEEQLLNECSITNSIHRIRILESIKTKDNCLIDSAQPDSNKPLDVFISYRRSNGSQLASLLKVHLQVRGFTVFIDVEKLEAGKFDNNLLQSIKQARNFLLVLTPQALDRCTNDTECKDWIHREIVAALQSQCNIIPIIDNFHWPEPEQLPEDMRAICHFNGIRWIHDYQDACVDKLERFMKGELKGGFEHGRYMSSPSVFVRSPPSFQRNQSGEEGGKD